MLLALQRPSLLAQTIPLQLRAQQIGLRCLARFVADAGQPFRLRPKRLQSRQQAELIAHQQQIDVGPLDLCRYREQHAPQIGLGLARAQAGQLAAQPALARPGKGLRRHDGDPARLHLADLDAAESVVLDAERKGRIRQHPALGHALLLCHNLRARLRQLGPLLHGVLDQSPQHGILQQGRSGRHLGGIRRPRRCGGQQEEKREARDHDVTPR
jgi:hypothetical protein